jgi:signal transduction histidine kinase
MQFRQLWRTTTFRLTVLYGLLFALGIIALLGLVYWRSEVYLTQRVDGILSTEADALMHSPRPGLRARLVEELTLHGDSNNIFGLFSADGTRVAGNLDSIPAELHANERPLELPPTGHFPSSARLIARHLPTGETLVVGRDVRQLQEMRAIITSALTWSGVSILLVGLACGTALSIAPLRRLRRLETVARDIAEGDLQQRMPTSQRRDELDMFADTVNRMMNEVERLMSEVKGATAVIAHDLLTPLAQVTLQLHRLQRADAPARDDIANVTAGIEEVLDRFRALLRIAELDARKRRAGVSQIDLAETIAPVRDLYEPLAEAAGVELACSAERGIVIEGDSKLLFEAVCNLVDNAIKFSGRGSTVQILVRQGPAGPTIIVEDDGPGIPSGERTAVLRRFYRGARNHSVPGSGLGLSIVAAIVHLHGFALVLSDADPGVRAVIECRPHAASRGGPHVYS